MAIGISPRKGNDQLFNNKNLIDENTKQNIIIALASILCIIVLASIFYFTMPKKKKNEKYSKNISLEGIKVSNYSRKELEDLLNERYEKRKNEDAIFNYGDYQQRIKGSDIGISYDIPKTLDQLDRIEEKLLKSKNKNNSNDKIENAIVYMDYDNEKLKNAYLEANSVFNNETNEYIINPDKKEVILNKNIQKIFLDEKEYKEKVLKKFRSNNFDQIEKLNVSNTITPGIDIDKMYNDITREPKNAYLDRQNGFIKEEYGIKFEKSLDEIKKEYNNASEKIIIKYNIIKPKMTLKELQEKLVVKKNEFKNILYEKTITVSDPEDKGAIKNISIASYSVNEYILRPGEIFSFNNVLGNRTREKGYQDGPVYENGKEIRGLGGGICFVSSGLYYVALYSNMQIIERSNHMFNPGYVPSGLDSAISMGNLDLKFKNTLSNPIKIITKFDGKNLKVQFLGTDEGYSVQIKTREYDNLKAKTEYRYNSNIEKGKKNIIQKGKDGLKVDVFRIIKKDGKEIERENLGTDSYNKLDEIIEIAKEEAENYDIIDLN